MKLKQLSIAFLCLLGVTMSVHAQTYDQLWKQVDQAENNGKPQTAIEIITRIGEKATAEKNAGQLLKATTERMKFRNRLTPDSFYVGVQHLEQWAITAEKPLDKAVIHSLLAEVYANYAAQNQWQLRQRTDIVDEEPSADIREWSSNQFVQQVLAHSREAFKDKELLLAASSQTYLPFVTQGEGSTYYKHDMYHLLGSRAVDALETVRYLDKDTVAVAGIQKLYKEMCATYNRPGSEEALVLVTLDYLNWNRSVDTPVRPLRRSGGQLGLAQDPYLAKLNRLIEQYKSYPVCAEVYLAKANYASGKQEQSAALQLCEEAIRQYPAYKRINALKQLKQSILNPELNAYCDKIVYPGEEIKLSVHHRNLDGFKVAFYRVNMTSIPKEEPEITDAFLKKNASQPTYQQIALHRTANYIAKDTTITLKMPAEGMYVMRIIANGDSKVQNGQFLYSTRMYMMTRTLGQDTYEMVVLDAQTGHPIPQATVALYTADNKLYKQLTTDTNGKCSLPYSRDYQKARVWKDTDQWMPYKQLNKSRTYLYDAKDNQESVTLLTDRSLYRPGQTVYVKGIAYTQQVDTAQVIAARTYELKLIDANHQEVAKQEVRTNEFGSFTANFALPAVCLNGTYTLQTPQGQARIRVEEYKRPTFDITFDKLEGFYQLGDSVQLVGHAQSFTGVPLQDTPVQYTVTRLLRMGFGGYYNANDELLDSGTAILDADGKFVVPVHLLGEADKSSFFLYHYQIDATVTNVAGETQSSSYTIAVGDPSLILSTNLSDEALLSKDTPIKLTFKVTNLDGQPVAVEGTYALYPITDTKKHILAKEPVLKGTFTANREMVMEAWQSLPSGSYELKMVVNDQQGREVEKECTIVLFSSKDNRPATDTPLWYHAGNTSFDAAHPATFSMGTSFKDAYVMMSVFQSDKLIEERTFVLTDSIVHFEYPYRATYGQGITIDFSLVKDGNRQSQQVQLKKRIPEKQLQVKWEVFRDKLRPGQQEEWKLTVKTPQGAPASAEMLALMYDASLDKIWKRDQSLAVGYGYALPVTQWTTGYSGMNYFHNWFATPQLKVPGLEYDRFPYMDYMLHQPRPMMIRGVGSVKSAVVQEEMEMVSNKTYSSNDMELNEVVALSDMQPVVAGYATAATEQLPEATADLRTNFAETAFFYPQLRTNEQGEIVFSFTMPESLTRWNFRGYAHTQGMLTGMLTGEATTSKEFMLTPNLPRFVRVGDKTSVAASVANLTGTAVNGTVSLYLFDPVTEKVIATQKQPFALEAGQTKGVSFRFDVTDKYDVLGCRLIADGGTFSDGEQHLLPVLSNKIMLTETVAMPLRGNQTRTFTLDKLFNNHSKTASNKQLTVEFTGNPAWYAIQALPALSLPVNDNAISWATTYYANALAAYIMNSQPRIKAVFDSWKAGGGTKETFMSNLQKNQEVKNILLNESPWVMEAKNEEQQKQRIATLFDLNNVANNRITALAKLKELQLSDGSFAWYKGMQGSGYITSYIAALNARLGKLTGASVDKQLLEMQTKAINFVMEGAKKEYKSLQKMEKEGKKVTALSGSAIEYLYIMALSNTEIGKQEMDKYFLSKAAGMLGTSSMTTKAKLAVVFNQAGRKQQADAYMASLKEHLATTDEQGMYFAFNENPYSWNGQPIPAHVQVIEAFDQVSNDEATVEEMKLWLLKQKQTMQWNSPVATADAVYALLYRGKSLTDTQGGARITFGDKVMDTQNSQMAGLNYIKETYTDKKAIEAKEITVAKRDAGIAWGAVYAQYQEDISKVAQQGNELNVDKKLYVERLVNNERQLLPVTSQTTLAVGDKVVSRITVRTDRAMEFVQLKDQRGACFEPLATLSGYHWGNGFGYYVDVKDASTNFFFDGLGKGVFVLEYAYRVARTGTYDAGLATIQCAYAPEYASHSASSTVVCE